MTRHHAGLDGLAIEPAEGLLPFLHRERIDGGDQVLVAVVIAFAGPVLDRRGDALRLERGDLRQRVALDHVDVAAVAAGGDDGAAEGGVDVDDRGKAPVEADGMGLAAMMVADGVVASTSSTAASASGLGTSVPKGRLMRLPSRSARDQQRHVALQREAVDQRDLVGGDRPRARAGDAARPEGLDGVAVRPDRCRDARRLKSWASLSRGDSAANVSRPRRWPRRRA